MAQIREFTSTTESYFILDGVKYPKSYEAVDDSSLNDNRLKVIPIGRTGEQLVFSTHYRNISVNGSRFNSLKEAISAINEVVFSKGGGSGDGGTGIQSIQAGENITIDNTDLSNPIVSANLNNSYSTQETLTGGTWIDGKPIYRKVLPFTISDIQTIVDISVLNKNVILKSEVILLTSDDKWITEYVLFVGPAGTIAIFGNNLEPDADLLVINSYNLEVSTGNMTTMFNGRSGFAILEYTKTTD